jgi:hypothetical protein
MTAMCGGWSDRYDRLAASARAYPAPDRSRLVSRSV